MTEEKPKRINGCLLLFLIFMVISALDVRIVSSMLYARYERIKSSEVTGKTPEMFPVLVVWESNNELVPTIIFYRDLPKYTKMYPSFSYTVPKSKVKALNNYLETHKYRPGLGVGKFTVTQHNGKQFFKVQCTGDHDMQYVGWYQADAKSFTPKRYCNYHGSSVAAAFLVHITLGNIILSLLLYLALLAYYKYRDRLKTVDISISGKEQ